jgi:hypothetical protein
MMRAVPAAGTVLSDGALFALLWDTLADVLGTSATAAILRRAARGASGRCPELAALTIVREELEYRYVVPGSWNARGGHTSAALRELVRELRPLLVEMTGAVVVAHLARVPELREGGLEFLTEEVPS